MLGQLAICRKHRNELLIRFHRRDQCFLRHGEELPIECAGNGDWPFGKVRDLAEQLVTQARLAADIVTHSPDFCTHPLAAFRRINEYLGRSQRIDIDIRGGDRHGLWMMEAMPARLAPAFDAKNLRVDDLITMQDHEPVNRAYEGIVVIAPAHRFGNRQRLQRIEDDVLHQRRGRLALLLRAIDEPGALVGLELFQLFNSDATGCSETEQRLGRLSKCIEPGIERRTAAFAGLILLCRSNAWQQRREPSR